jgi:3-deoxy-D-manno-octulosonic-acid transferase
LPALAPHLVKNSLRLILVPHEPTPEHLQALARQLDKLGLTHTLFSRGKWHDENILLVDQVGVLAELYAWGQFAFIGGSFKKTVHSVMEALGAGCLTFVGPYHKNNREAVQFHDLRLGSLQGVEVVQDARELSERMALLLAHPELVVKFSEDLQKEFSLRLGASRRLIISLQDLL